MTPRVPAASVKRMLTDGNEIALLDVREAGQYAAGHPFLAVPLAYSRLGLDLERLVPRRGCRLVLLDDGDGVAERAAGLARDLGYRDVAVLDGGAAGWQAAGYTLFDGVNLPSKTFGELVEIERHTPRITAAELEAMRQRGDDMVIVDGRTWDEYRRFAIPGGISCPNGELPLRIAEIVPDPKTRIVVNCAGRTRSIIGAQTLIDLGVPNPVVALENGTQGWFLAGLEVQRGASRKWPEVAANAPALDVRRAQARAHAARHGVGIVSPADVRGWLSDGGRTTYLLDVRTHDEAAAAPFPGFVHAPGGQLQQATDQWIGVRGGRLLLADSDGVRAPMVAAWMRQLGHQAYVLANALDAATLVGPDDVERRTPSGPDQLEAFAARLRPVSPQGLSALLWSGGGRAIDLRSSQAYRDGHVPGSVWSVRPRLADVLGPEPAPVVLIADAVEIAAASSRDLAEMGVSDVAILAGGVEAWQADGQPLNSSPGHPADADRIDFIFHTHRRHDGDAEAARAYIAWEIGLVERLDADERGIFRLG